MVVHKALPPVALDLLWPLLAPLWRRCGETQPPNPNPYPDPKPNPSQVRHAHRGRDVRGVWHDGRAGRAHRRRLVPLRRLYATQASNPRLADATD